MTIKEKLEMLRQGTHGCNTFVLGFNRLFGATSAARFAELKKAYNAYELASDIRDHALFNDLVNDSAEADIEKALENFVVVLEDGNLGN